MDRLTATEQALMRHLDLPADFSVDELRREANDALQRASDMIDPGDLVLHLANVLAKMGQPYNAEDCEQAAVAIWKIAHA